MDAGTDGLDALDAALPESLPALPGLSVSGRYVLDGRTTSHGGNGLKAIPLPDGRLMMAVVDALGHGAVATSAAIRVLAVLRGLLESGVSAAEAVASVDRYAARAPLATGASVAVAVISQRDGETEVATAGHPPPIRLRPDGEVVPIGVAPTRPLGLGGTAASAHFVLRTGETLIMHTDGLVTGRDGATWTGIQDLHALLGRLAPQISGNQRTEQLCARLLSDMQQPHGFRDDVALLMAERTPKASDFHVTTGAHVEDAVEALALFGSWLSGIGVGMLDEMAVNQAVSEAVDNVVVHAYPVGSPDREGGLRISASINDAGVLCAKVADTGAWRTTDDHAGRGLVIAGGLVDRLRLVRSAEGTEVVLEQRLTRPIPLLRADGALHRAPAPRMTLEKPERLHVAGAVDGADEEDFRDALHRATGAGTHDATVVLTDVTTLSRSAVRALFDQAERSADSGVTLTVEAAPGSVARRVLDQYAFPRPY